MPRLPAEKRIAADSARTGIVEPVPNTAVIFEIRNLGVIPISIMEDRRLDIQTFDLASGCRQSHERILTSGEERSLFCKNSKARKTAAVSSMRSCGCPCFHPEPLWWAAAQVSLLPVQ